MDRVGCEKVSQSPLTFESIFSISASALSAIDQMLIKSERSGFGWTFRIVHASAPAVATGQPISRRAKTNKGQVADTAVASAAPASTPTVSISNAILHLELEPTTLALSGQLMFDRVACQFNSTSLGERCFDKTNFVFSSNTILGTLVYAAGDAVTITISIEIGHRADAISKSIDGRVAAALEDSLHSGDILDAKVYTYSKRCGYRKASHPRATFINSSILAKIGCEDLDAYFTTKGFGESKPTVLDLHHISSEDSVTDAYDYDSDSDLEEEDDETLPDVKLETAERMNELADDLMLTQGETNKRFLRTGRVVFFRATAYRTWATFMRFVYFDKIAYAKLKSTYIDEEAAVARFSDKTCSPKSMYRFADYFGIENLQNSALGSIKQQLTVDNIVKELFSEFSSHHPKVIEVEVAFLKENFSHQKVRDGLQDIALRACDGERYMAPALKRVFAEITVTPPEICLWPEKCSYNQRCGECGSYHVYHHD